jgi:hypothetical protein
VAVEELEEEYSRLMTRLPWQVSLSSKGGVMARELSDEELEALIEQELWWRSPEGQIERALEDAQIEDAMRQSLAALQKRIDFMHARYELKTMGEKQFAERMLKIVLTIRDAEKVRDGDVSDDFIAGFEQGLSELATFLVEEFGLDAKEK